MSAPGPQPASPDASGGARRLLARPALLARAALGGALMGLANLVPGISGGTMLLATGVYTGFVSAIAELTTLRWRTRSIVLLAVIAGSAAAVILLLAGPTRTLVLERRWIMYSLFIGLTLGGVPIVWRLARPGSGRLALGALAGVGVMALMLLAPAPGPAGESPRTALLVVAGVAGASAMILPGVSGGYLLLLLGQYLPILGAVDLLKQALLDAPGAPDLGLALEAVRVLAPVGVGVVLGIVGMSNLIEWLLRRYRQATLGVLLGLLLGAVLGLWPFQRSVEPAPTPAATHAELDPEDWPVERFPPTAPQLLASLALIAAGFTTTRLIGRLGRDGP